MQTLLKACVIVGLLICVSGCATRAVVIDSQVDVVRLGKGVRGPGYIYRDGEWQLVKKFTYPEGWYAGPMPASDK